MRKGFCSFEQSSYATQSKETASEKQDSHQRNVNGTKNEHLRDTDIKATAKALLTHIRFCGGVRSHIAVDCSTGLRDLQPGNDLCNFVVAGATSRCCSFRCKFQAFTCSIFLFLYGSRIVRTTPEFRNSSSVYYEITVAFANSLE